MTELQKLAEQTRTKQNPLILKFMNENSDLMFIKVVNEFENTLYIEVESTTKCFKITNAALTAFSFLIKDDGMLTMLICIDKAKFELS